MKFEKFYIENIYGKSNCVIRSFCKLFNKEYNDVCDELCSIQKELNSSSYNDIEVFETYMKRNNVNKIECENNIRLRDLNLKNGSYIIFCWDKKNFYHMVTIIDNILFDKDVKSLDLYVISIYKKH